MDLYPLGTGNGYPIYRSGTGNPLVGFQAIVSAEIGAALLNFEWHYQILNDGELLAAWREDNPTEDTTPTPDLVVNWIDTEAGSLPVDSLPVFTPIPGPIASPSALTSAAAGNRAPTAPALTTSAAGGNLSPTAPGAIS